jgi:DNA replication protein DnaC
LATGAWLREKQALLILGPPGVGKTHLAIALGVRAVESGSSVAFFRLEELLHAMRQGADVPPTRLRGKKYMKAGLVIIDEVVALRPGSTWDRRRPPRSSGTSTSTPARSAARSTTTC